MDKNNLPYQSIINFLLNHLYFPLSIFHLFFKFLVKIEFLGFCVIKIAYSANIQILMVLAKTLTTQNSRHDVIKTLFSLFSLNWLVVGSLLAVFCWLVMCVCCESKWYTNNLNSKNKQGLLTRIYFVVFLSLLHIC